MYGEDNSQYEKEVRLIHIVTFSVGVIFLIFILSGSINKTTTNVKEDSKSLERTVMNVKKVGIDTIPPELGPSGKRLIITTDDNKYYSISIEQPLTTDTLGDYLIDLGRELKEHDRNSGE